MSDEKPDKESQTEEPTEYKIRKEEEKGNLPFSRELPVFASLVSFSLICVFISFPAISKLTYFLIQWLERPESWRINTAEDVKHLIYLLGGSVGLALAPILILIPLLSITASAVQNVPRFVIERIRPQWSRISPANGFKRIYSKAGLVEFLKSLTKLIAVSLIIYIIFFKSNTIFINALLTDASALPKYIHKELINLSLSFITAVIALVGLDIAWSRFHWRQQLRMTKQEIKEEHKNLEGNPMVKARMRSLSRDRIRRRMIANVPTATLIVTNPTHFSVALRYKPPLDYAPVVIAKGLDILALHIREIAIEHEIPIFENVTLARTLYKQVEIDQTIPTELYESVAALIRFINNQKNH
ncbi:flagellar biosynthesis protein FlhB [Bartonella rochalimae]|uniref:Flagellar biosynthetic protein FlhB n=1 Tax=Bartonella rochalimae ATCC BAA-1498 TaxID=685782 RepID=E6YKZ7_9HYPH|nr:flagellar biosynthesis protein FlhB [Bartonella rochalimae]KEC54243.1 flagellar biosynthetic protein FlhB [Bartonella rochalimae ATCC BAA-1498]CBI77535.1 Flagellar biosynthetic protein flhB [Bartonella rochalimae ATCC BAA-1498]